MIDQLLILVSNLKTQLDVIEQVLRTNQATPSPVEPVYPAVDLTAPVETPVVDAPVEPVVAPVVDTTPVAPASVSTETPAV